MKGGNFSATPMTCTNICIYIYICINLDKQACICLHGRDIHDMNDLG